MEPDRSGRLTTKYASVLILLAFVLAALLPASALAENRTAPDAFTTERDTNRPGADIERIVMEPGERGQCEEECRNNPICVAYTWVRKDVTGPKPVCWLKSEAPAAKANDCCVSGTRVSTGFSPAGM